MRIGFDVSPLVRPHPPGIVRATRGLVEALERRGRVEIVRLSPPPCAAVGRWRQFDVPRAVRARGLHGIHSPVSAFPILAPGVRVQTIHEVPWSRDVSENADVRHRLWASVGPLRAHAILCPSRATADLVRSGSPLAAHKVQTCGWGVDAVFTPRAQAHDDALLEQMGLDPPFVIAPGAVREKKNPTAVLRGLGDGQSACTLVITGPLTAHVLQAVAQFPAARVRLVGEVGDLALAALVRRAVAVVVLSQSEGFGLPVIEAQACGTPVIVSAGSTQAEIAGGAALAIDPDEAGALAAAIERAFRDRGQLAAAGLANAARFTWDRCAAQVEQVWEATA